MRQVEVRECAVDAEPGRRSLAFSDLPTTPTLVGAEGLPNAGGLRTIKVEADSLDSLVGDGAVSLIKVDVEGAEERVLAGAEKLLSRSRPVWIVEVHGAQLHSAVQERFEAAGYSVESLEETRLRGSMQRGSLVATPRR